MIVMWSVKVVGTWLVCGRDGVNKGGWYVVGVFGLWSVWLSINRLGFYASHSLLVSAD